VGTAVNSQELRSEFSEGSSPTRNKDSEIRDGTLKHCLSLIEEREAVLGSKRVFVYFHETGWQVNGKVISILFELEPYFHTHSY